VVVALAWATVARPDGTADEAPIPESRLEVLLDGGSAAPGATRRYAEADLAPYFASSALARAKALFDRRRFAEARAALRGEDPPVRFLAALARLHADPAAAAADLRALASDYPQLADHCLFEAAGALERLRKRRAAASAYGEVGPRSALFAESRLRQSRVLERALDLDGALEALASLRELPATPRNDDVRRRALLAAARICQKRGDYRGEHRAMLELWATSPLSREAQAVWERLRELPIPNRWRLRRAESFLAFHDNQEAMRLALQVKTVLPDEDACRAAFVVGNALRKERQHRKAVAALAPMVASCTASELRPEAMYVLAYSQSIVAPDDAVRTYEALAREYPAHAFADDALFFAGELEQRAGRREAALERWERVVDGYGTGNFAPEALFQLAWQRRAAGALDAALATLDRLERLPGVDREQRVRGRYWRARILADRRDPGAGAAFAALAADHPASWYGLLARARLHGDAAVAAPTCGPASPSAAASTWPLEAGPLGADPRFLAGVELVRMELPDAASDLLAIDPRGLPDDAARLLVEALQRTGRAKAAEWVTRATLGRGLTGGMNERNAAVWEATYPRPFRSLVERWAKPARVDPDLLQALMREESRFNRWARSSTGAIGLTQLMPRTARAVAAELRLGAVTPEALHRPALNVRLGAAYLGTLLAELDGSKVRAVAAYNAGPEAVARWLRARPDAELDAWVEQIPSAETRDYVKRVLGSYGAYRLVYGGAPTALDEPIGPVAAREPRGG
jgi:soluble lytic murein transglycosylase